MKGILRGAYCVALSISIFLCGVILALSCRGITLYKKELLQNGMTVAITLFMAACIVMLCVYGKDKLQTTRRKFSVFLFLLIGLAQIAFLLLVSRPMTIADPARVQNEALAMLKYHHGQMDPTNSYMQNYGNNHFITICFYYFYKFLTDVGITKVWVPTVVLNVLAIDLGILLTFLSVKKMRGIGTANFALVLFFLCPTTYRQKDGGWRYTMCYWQSLWRLVTVCVRQRSFQSLRWGYIWRCVSSQAGRIAVL